MGSSYHAMQSDSQDRGARSPSHPPEYHRSTLAVAQGIKRKPLPLQSPVLPNNSKPIHSSTLTELTNVEKQDGQLFTYRPKKPFWLRTWVVASLAALLATVFAMMFVLRQYSLRLQGFKLTLSDNHYAWTYGPTLIMVILVSLWRQVDYYCKTTIAWATMDQGPATAQKSILLDYLWPLQTTTLKKGVQNRHNAVVLSTLAFVMLKIVVLASPGLLVLVSTDILGPISINMNTKFSGENFWSTVLRGDDAGGENYARPLNFSLYWDPGRLVYTNISTSPISAYVKDVEQRFSNSSSPEGVTVLQSYSPPSSTGDVKEVSAYVDAFVPNSTCEVATVGYYQVDGYGIGLTFDSPTCSVGHQERIDSSTGKPFNQSWLPQSLCKGSNCAPYELVYASFRVNCSDYSGSRGGSTIQFTSSTEHQYNWAFVALNMTSANRTGASNTSVGAKLTYTMTASSAVICKIDYQMVNASLTYHLEDVANETTSVSYGQNKGHLADFSGQQLSEALIGSMVAWRTPAIQSSPVNNIYSLMIMFELVSRTLNKTGPAGWVTFFDADLLSAKATDVLRGTSSRFMEMLYMRPENVQSTGVAHVVEQRLHVGSPSFWTMTMALLTALILALSTIFTTKNFHLPRDTNSVGGMAAILSSSHTLNAILHDSGGCSRRDLKAGLNRLVFRTHFSRRAEVDVTDATSQPSDLAIPYLHSRGKARWVPYAGRKHAILLTICVPLIAIAILEILQQLSWRNNGVLRIKDEKSAVVYVIKYGSTAIALLIATLYNMLDFTVATFTPFILLRAGAKPAHRSILVHTLGCLPPVAIYRSIRCRCGSAMFAGLAAIIGSTLTIVVSGLWVLESSIQQQAAVTTTLATFWDPNWPNSVRNDNGASFLFNRIQHGEAEMPSNIWQNLVLPDIKNITSSGQSNVATTSYHNHTLIVPALRPVLDCSVVPTAQCSVSGSSEKTMVYSAEYNLPSGCFTGPGANLSSLRFDGGVMVNGGQIPRVYVFSAFMDVHMGPWNDTSGSTGELNNQSLRSDSPAGCPSIAIIFGKYNTSGTAVNDMAVLVCNQKLQQVPTRVTFVGQPVNMIFDPRSPPSPDEASAVYLDNGTKGVESFPFRIETALRQNLIEFTTLSGYTYDLYSHFFDHLVLGPNGTFSGLYPDKTCNPCLGPFKNEKNCCKGYPDTEALKAAINRLYQKYMVLAINMNLKKPIAEPDAAKYVVYGNTTTIESKLMINYNSKLTLQICLAVMTILGVSTLMLVDLQNTLPAPPTSIATTMSLLAGSEMCDPSSGTMPRNAAYMSDSELTMSLNGYLFSLGWWGRARPSQESLVVRDEGVSQNVQHVEARTLLSTKEKASKRFGIDIGTAETSGFKSDAGSGLFTWFQKVNKRKKKANMDELPDNQ